MSKVGHDCPPVMRRRRRALLASKVRRGQGNRISPANNLKGSRAGRKVGYAPCDDQPGSNPFDLRIVVAFGDAILESRRFCEDASGPSGCAPQSSICRGVRKRNYHNWKDTFIGKRILAIMRMSPGLCSWAYMVNAPRIFVHLLGAGLALRVISRRRTNSVAFGAKRTFS